MSGHDEIENSSAPLMEHLTELRERLIKSVLAFILGTRRGLFRRDFHLAFGWLGAGLSDHQLPALAICRAGAL